jgi:hypothetical protein
MGNGAGSPEDDRSIVGEQRRIVSDGVRSARRGRSIKLLGLSLTALALAINSVAWNLSQEAHSKSSPIPVWGWWAIAEICFISAATLVRKGSRARMKGRRLGANEIDLHSIASGQDFVLYLRPFRSDEALSSIGEAAPAMFNTALVMSKRTEEEQLREAVRPIGSLVAIGRPGEDVPYVGAMRGYLSADDWQETVLRLMGTARLVMLGIGHSSSLIWELTQATRHLPPERLLLLITGDEDEYRAFCAAYASYFPRGLPSNPPARDPFISLKGAIYFAPDWTAHLAGFSLSTARTVFYSQIESAFVNELKPVYERLGARWPGMRGRFPRTATPTRRQLRKFLLIVMTPVIFIIVFLALIGMYS